MRALLVEDEPASRRLAMRLLHHAGYDVEAVADAASARAAVARTDYDLVVLDFVLPDADGLQLLREWRLAGHTFPALALTGAQSDAIVEGFLRAGANDVIEKMRFDSHTLRVALDGLAEPTPFPRTGALERPRAPPDERAMSVLVESGSGAHPARAVGRALIVDDVAVVRRHVAALLRKEGWQADEAETAEEGLRRAVETPYGVILVDQLLPDVEGIGLLVELRRRGVETPVIALTGHGDETLAMEFIEAGAVDFIPKDTLDAPRLREALELAVALSARIATRAE